MYRATLSSRATLRLSPFQARREAALRGRLEGSAVRNKAHASLEGAPQRHPRIVLMFDRLTKDFIRGLCSA